MSSGLRTKIKLNKVFYQVINNFKKENISVVMPTYVPQRGEILKDFANFAYIPDLDWSGHIKERNLDTEIIASVEQDLRKYFEEKGNLITILKAANLENYTIPTREILPTSSVHEIKEVYKEICNEQGKIVLQSCHASTGAGKGTLFIDSAEELLSVLDKDKGYYKATRFIKGSESNLSFFSGNTLVSQKSLGAKKISLENLNPNSPQTLFNLFERAKKEGILDENIVTLVGRATLKSVGDENLTSSPANGVGNDIGYIFPEQIAEQIKEIGDKLSRTLAKAGRVGLAGADLIIDEQGKVWINEINDRQQGPTSQMSKDAEANELPSLMKIALVASFADFNFLQNSFSSFVQQCLQFLYLDFFL
ncbi:MAG: YheC/YheD family protein [Alphaproteobacteria bacterium]